MDPFYLGRTVASPRLIGQTYVANWFDGSCGRFVTASRGWAGGRVRAQLESLGGGEGLIKEYNQFILSGFLAD